MKSEIFPVRLARKDNSPPGISTTSSRSPGRTPRCKSISGVNVISLLAVVVSTVMVAIPSLRSVIQIANAAKRGQSVRASLYRLAIILGMSFPMIAAMPTAEAQTVTREQAMRAAIHPVGDGASMKTWLGRVPVTRDFPDDFAATLREQGSAFIIEMTSTPGCVPCGDLWLKLGLLARRYGWRLETISGEEAMVRSGRLGLPWVGYPVAWVRPVTDENRTIPVAIGTDHSPNLARNLYLAAKMLTGVRAAVGVRAMSKFTGIVGMPSRSPKRR